MDLSIIIVSWNVKEKLRANLQALLASKTDFSFEVFVVDNNSGDGSAEMVKEEFPKVKLIANTENLGFAKANNQAIKEAKGNFILLLNPDMQVYSDTLENSLNWAKKNQQAVVSGFKLVNEKNEIIKQVRKFPKLFDQLMIVLKVPHLVPSVLDSYLLPNFDYEKEAKIDSIRGAFFLINKESYKKISGQDKPLLDERYFIWFEEVDFCKEVYRLGGEVWYSPSAKCLDYVGASFSQVKLGQTQRYFCDSMLRYFKKWEPKADYFTLKLAWRLVVAFIK
ncbi:glycosyltransferase family 2 protein [Candidatus Falkowbacteria bacterium]|nr:glycosyltransferase family 2 protein [Candidatus Falkowbacteria bacterium]